MLNTCNHNLSLYTEGLMSKEGLFYRYRPLNLAGKWCKQMLKKQNMSFPSVIMILPSRDLFRFLISLPTLFSEIFLIDTIIPSIFTRKKNLKIVI